MNWKRGLFRVWLVLSIVWVVGATAWCINFASTPRDVWRDPTPQEIEICVAMAEAQGLRGTRCDDRFSERKLPPLNAPNLTGYAFAIFIPPLGVWVVALITAWIGRGFRRVET